MLPSDQENTLRDIIHYHEETKHHYHRYAKSAGYMDWENQPNPFRFYENTQVLELPFIKKDPQVLYPDLYRREKNPPQKFGLQTVAGILELSLGLSAWKAAGESQWPLRINPSSGNLHPTETHLVLPQIDDVEGGVFHYNPLIHGLERRAPGSDTLWQNMLSHIGGEGFLLGFSSIYWRESWKYGERAFRYCNHDVGHALAAVSFAANLFGWKISFLNGLADDALDSVLGFGKTQFSALEKEHPELLCVIYPHHQQVIARTLPDDIISAFSGLEFMGKPNTLSRQPKDWRIIYKTADLTRKPATQEENYDFAARDWIVEAPAQIPAVECIRQRRSATSFDPEGSLGKDQFLAILDKTLPRSNCAPFDTGLMTPAVHLLIFVHQVDGLSSGLYFFFRNENDVASVKRLARSNFLWEPVKKDFPLFLLEKGNYRQSAMMVSCHQEIAGSSAFSLGMIAGFRDLIANKPYYYRQLFWESGMIGQVLYLAAEAHGVRGTGIGCFFDDAVHEILGFKDNQYQSLYHFTIGRPVEDPRLTTYPPYHHLKNR
ncbi:MAG: SagB/ThcOx family dehydrogenase [Deltaproteobacteria bacterium]|nr:SagB/ThcOx family dehydrogenase [Deltaproteobacteria bacterium]